MGWPGRKPGSGQGSTGVKPRRHSIDVRDDTGKAIGCHYELTAARRISQDVVVMSAAPAETLALRGALRQSDDAFLTPPRRGRCWQRSDDRTHAHDRSKTKED
jgi:hypothetical protein